MGSRTGKLAWVKYEDAENNFQPKSLKFWTIIIGMYLSIFSLSFAVQLQTCGVAKQKI
jgi:hypothetical protein